LAFILRPSANDKTGFSNSSLNDATDEFQRQHITKAIERAGGNMSDAARLLGLHRSNLYRKMRMLQMEVPS
jgi:DNA-binding NtrC family response regulator